MEYEAAAVVAQIQTRPVLLVIHGGWQEEGDGDKGRRLHDNGNGQ